MSDDAKPVMTRDTLTVSALNRAVAGLLARSFPLVRVRGELANLTRAASGHWYFTLKDDAAQVRCAMFRSRNALVNFAPQDGDAVEVLGQVGLYEARGEFQLSIESMERAGLGRLFEEFLRLKTRLAAEGLFDEACKKPLPVFPQTIGVVTSVQAAALRDVLTTLRRRAPQVRIIVYPVPVQGAGAGERIAQMLDRMSRRAEVDVALLVRGGGSIEDLWAFNEEVVARALRACRLPVVVGVGHESDFTIADFAADLRAPTPTAAAELAAPERDGLVAALVQRRQRLLDRLQHKLDVARQRIDYAQRAVAAPRAPVRGLEARVQALLVRAGRAIRIRFAAPQGLLVRRAQRLARQRPEVAAVRSRLQIAAARLGAVERTRQDARANRFAGLSASLDALDPNAVLARGYALAYAPDGCCVLDVKQLAIGDKVRLQFARGHARAQIDALSPGGGKDADVDR